MSLDIRSVCKEYSQANAKISVLKNLDLHVATGEIVAVLGQSGSGKSTLLSLLAGLDQPDSGKIEIDGIDITKMSPLERTRFRGSRIGVVFQQYHLLAHLNALENVVVPLEIAGEPFSTAQEKAKSLLEQVGLGHRLKHLPSQLSGGECQRVAIARALVTKPRLILADEPSGSLDVDTGIQVMELLFSVVRQHRLTTIVVTHSEDIASRCDRRFTLKHGQLQ